MTVKFKGNLAFLSNYTSVAHGIHGFNSVEHFYVAMKSTDQSFRDKIHSTDSPGAAKRLGRSIKLRSDWDDIKLDVMEHALRKKFLVGSWYAEKLLEVDDSDLIEINTWHDNFWGDCRCTKCQAIEGENNLGKLLRQVKSELIQASF